MPSVPKIVKRFIAGFFLIFVCMANDAIGQTTVLITEVRDEKGALFQNATAALYHLPDSVLIKKTVVKDSAVFELMRNNDYYLLASASGKETATKNISATDPIQNITVTLAAKSTNLANVTVVSRKPLIKQEDDKTIVDAAALVISSTNAYEVLEKTPGAVVDQDGNVYLNSTSPATVFINGREMKLGSADLASLLKSLPANSVSKIEILPNPSAKFDAASSGGIINIVLKKGVKLSTSGTVNLGYIQGVYSTKTGGISMNKSSDNLTSYFSYQHTNRKNFEKLSSERKIVADSTLLTQDSYTTYPSSTHYIGMGTDWAINKKWNLAYDLRISATHNISNALNKIDISNFETQTVFGKNASAIGNNNNSLFIGNTISTKYKIDSLGSEWNNVAEYTYFNYNNEQLYSNFRNIPARPTVIGDGATVNRKNIIVIQSDLVWKLPKKYTLETGLKTSFSFSSNTADYFIDTGNNIRRPDPVQTNAFEFKETIGAAYVQIAKTFFGFTVKPGIRLEYTDINGRQLIPGDTTFSIKRTDAFPFVFLKHKLFKMFGYTLMGNAIFRKTIRRPYYESLNPYPKYIDQYLFEAGNPALKPQFTTNYEMNVTFNDIPVLAFGLNQTRDLFSNVTYQDNDTKIALRTFDNLGKNKEYYFKIIGGIPPGGKYFFYMGAQYNYNEYRGFYQNQPLNYNRGSYTFFMFHEFKATKKLTANMQGFMRTKGLQNLYELNNFGGLYISLNHSILKKKGNIILFVSDVLRTNRVGFSINQADVNATGKRINDTNRLGLTFRYNFGLKPKEEKKNMFDTNVESESK